MQLFWRSASALIALMILTGAAYAADPAEDPASEAQAISGDEGKSAMDSTEGAGPTDADDSAMESEQISGDEGKSSMEGTEGSGPTPADDAEMESEDVTGGN